MYVDAESKKERMGFIIRGIAMLLVSCCVAALTHSLGLNTSQVLSCGIFIMIIMATLLFWKFRLAIAFVGIGLLMGTGVLDLPTFLEECKLDVILFLVGMMVTVGVLKELGLFTWIIQLVINSSHMTGPRFVVIIVLLGALMGCVVDEVTSIVFVVTLIFQVCDTLKVRPIPFVMIAVMGTNVGSCGTMLGNPVGILIGQSALPPLSFIDFLTWSFPIMFASLLTTLLLLCWWFRSDIRHFSERLTTRREMGLGLGPMVQVPYRRGLFVLIGLIGFIAMHHQIEQALGLAPNTVMIVAPLVVAGLLMIWRHERARHYIEADVEWWTLLFFMMLFAVAGTLSHTHVTDEVARGFQGVFGNNQAILIPVIMALSAIGSAFVDNIVFVAAFMPVVNSLEYTPLLWALLHGACLGGNITMIGSTANIVALGMLEKRYRVQIRFFEWFKVGIIIGLVSCLVSWIGIAAFAHKMPTKEQRMVKYRQLEEAHRMHSQKIGAEQTEPKPNE